jgi:phosphate/sulfate permease
MRQLTLAWTVTPLVAGLIAGLSFLIAVRMTKEENNCEGVNSVLSNHRSTLGVSGRKLTDSDCSYA